ncbi:MAG: hypothetical protein GY739_13345 [Mesoflavibacter sp.]|uniref:hypothetical protein n=1 Tax=Mesoflavibacter zeaxanthinifaciens TaxID=393060 RepID=UPI0026F27CDC|nr:hypothetical protein [Mesoflavibacter zeaxanthinifaciens]MCP4054026.1 hypothetical protein [Mesoflavibacter sp.]
MKKLTKEDIQFIDTYLDNSDVVYADVRLEMVDHIASDIENSMKNGDERDFYYIFKDYMVNNKASLLNNYKSFKSKTLNKLTLKLLRSFLTLKSIFLTCVLLGLGLFFKEHIVTYLNEDVFIMLWFFTTLLVFVLWLYSNTKTKTRFIAIEQLFLAMLLLTYFAKSAFIDICMAVVSVSNKDYLYIGLLVFFIVTWFNFISITIKNFQYYSNRLNLI